MDKIRLIISLLPNLILLIKTVESAFPEKGQGATKLALVRELLTSIDSSIPAIWPLVESAIATIVKALNVSGYFKG